jgi:hypothetical protein
LTRHATVNEVAFDGLEGKVRRRSRLLAALLVGAGSGAVGGSYVGSAALLGGALLALVGVGLYLVTPRTGSDTSGDGPGGDRPTLASLGAKVEEVLRLAEEQAEGRRADAEREAQQILSAARLEAAAILDRARTAAAERAGTPRPPDTAIG